MKYSKAPVSEVIVGVTFETPLLYLNQIFAAQNRLQQEFPVTEIRPPLVNESLVGFKLSHEIDPSHTGPFLLRMRA